MRRISFFSITVLLLAIIGRLLFMVIPAAGNFTTFETIAVDQCARIENVPGPEDIQIDHRTGLAYISSMDRRTLNGLGEVGIYVLDLNSPGASARKLEGALPNGFSPHGISFWQEETVQGEAGERRLFVVNHPNGGHAVEVFKLGSDDRLIHLETITSDTFTFPNDVVAIGQREFYVTNMQRAVGGISLTAELYLGLPITDVVHYDGTNAVQAANGLITANGLNISPDGRELYVAEATARRINIFKRDPVTGKLSDRKRIAIGTGPDNIDVAPDGSLYIGAHPNLLAFTKHAVNPDAISPSHVIRLDPASGEQETVFMSINGEIDGSSVGPYWRGNLLVGGVFEDHILWCSQ